MALQKKPKADARRSYVVFVELGLALSLLLVIAAFQVDLGPGKQMVQKPVPPLSIEVEEIVATTIEQPPPPPPPPPVPVVVPEEEILEGEELEFRDISEYKPVLPPLPPMPAYPSVQEEKEQESEPIMVAQDMPELIGGLKGLVAKIHYPEAARQAGVQGRVMVQFVVDKQGNVTDAVVLKGIGGGCDEEALRVVREAKFKPGKQRGKPVKVRLTLPVVFKLR